MNIATLLKDALISGDWSGVSEAYFMLSGERIEPLESDTASILLSIMKKLDGLTQSNPKKITAKKQKANKKQVDSSFSVVSNKPSRKVTDRRNENKFDNMQDIVAEAEKESGYDKINDNIKPSNRSRKSYSTKSVTCTECGSSNEVNPLFARDTYICDRCLQRRGR
jgi:hypothetical protein